MTPLCGDERFKEFMQVIEDLKEQAVEFAATHDSVKDTRATLAALGTVRSYIDILGIYKNAIHVIEDEQRRFEEEKEQAS